MGVNTANKERNKIFLCASNLLQSGPPNGILQGGIRVSTGTSVRDPEIQEGAYESLKDPIALVTFCFIFFILLYFFFVFSTILSLFRKTITVYVKFT
jgi:hypothetical protein